MSRVFSVIIALAVLFIVIAIVGMVILSVMLPLWSSKSKTREPLQKKPALPPRSQLQAVETDNYLIAGYIPESRNNDPFPLSEDVRTYNIINLAPIGKGKTRLMMSYVLQDIRRTNNTVFIYDPQRDLTEEIVSLCHAYGRKYTIFPDAGFNPLALGDTARTRTRLFADVYAQVSRSGKEGGGIYFSELAQTFILLVVPLFEVTEKCFMTLQELLLVCENKAFRQMLYDKAPASMEKSEYHNTFGSWTEKDFKENLLGITIFIRRLTADGDEGEPYVNWLNQRNAPTLKQCIEEKQVIIVRAGDYPNTIGSSLGLLFQVAFQTYVMGRNMKYSNHFIAAYIDELPLYLNDNFRSLIATARKKRVSLFCGFQQIKQLDPYEDTITGNALTWLIHNGLGAAETKYISETLGEQEVFLYSKNTPNDVRQSASVTQSAQFEPILRATDIRNIPQEQVLMIGVKPLRIREVDTYRYLIKPPLDELNATVSRYRWEYVMKVDSIYPPPHIWVKS